MNEKNTQFQYISFVYTSIFKITLHYNQPFSERKNGILKDPIDYRYLPIQRL